MKRVAILGGGPAGAFAAEQLASAGLAVQLFDEKLAWEKPCGGGLTYKAYNQYPFLIDNDTPKRFVTRDHAGGLRRPAKCCLKLDQPLVIYSRFDLNRMLLERAETRRRADRKGARAARSRAAARAGGCAPAAGTADADFCIVATGARNPLRDVGTRAHAAGHHVRAGLLRARRPGRASTSSFCRDLEGYIWVFPRCGHLSVGICGKGEPAGSLRQRLERFMSERGICLEGRGVLQPPAALARRRLRGATTAWRAKAGWRWATRPAWWIPSPAKACTTPSARPTWRRARCSPKSASVAESCANTARLLRHDFAGRPGVRLAPRQARLPGPLPVRLRARAHGAVHAPQPALFRASCRTCSPAGSPTRPEAPAAAQSERQPVRHRHEPGLQPRWCRAKRDRRAATPVEARLSCQTSP